MISDSTALICLAKLNQLQLLKNVYKNIVIPVEVKKEVLVAGKPGYELLKDAQWITVQQPKKQLELGLGKGEQAAISLSYETKEPVLLDDALAIKAAKTLGITTERTTTVLFRAVKIQQISRKQAITLLNQLVDEGYYIAPKYYAALYQALAQ